MVTNLSFYRGDVFKVEWQQPRVARNHKPHCQ